MRRALLSHLLKRSASAFSAGSLAPLSTRAAAEAAAPAWTPVRSALGLASLAAGASTLAYYSLAPAQAESPVSAAAAAAPTSAPPEDRYVLPPATGTLPKAITVYQYEVCPFCCKVKAFLDYHKLPYRVVEVNPLTKGELKWSAYKKVPVVVLDDKEAVNDSSAIISRLAAELNAQKAANESSKGWFTSRSKGDAAAAVAAAAEEERWRRWVDERLVRVITVNIYRTAREAFQTFDYISEAGNFGWVHREAARLVGATMMWSLSGRLRKKYDVQGDVRQALYACADEWVAALGGRRFMGGDSPNLADLSVFGVMKSVTGTDTFMDLQHETTIGPWYEAMMGAVGESSRLPS